MKRTGLKPRDTKNDPYTIVELRVIAVWNDGLVEDWSNDIAPDSTLGEELENHCVDYEDLRNQNPTQYNASEWSSK